MIIIQILLIVLFPFLSYKLTHFFNVEKWLSPVVLCYAAGILISNLGLIPLDNHISTLFTQVSILIAIPLLLYSTDIVNWFKYAKSTLISFGLIVVTGMAGSIFAAFVFRDTLPHTWMYAGMLTGIFTGGTPNLNAIGLALHVPEAEIVIINTTEIVWGGIYLIFLTSIAKQVIGRFLPDFAHENEPEMEIHPKEIIPPMTKNIRKKTTIDIAKALLLTVFVTGISVGLTKLLTGNLESIALLILLLTTFSIISSFSKKVRNLRGTYETGDYFLLVFSIAIGLLADFSKILENGLDIFLFTGSVLLFTISFHYWLAKKFKIDTDTAIITSTAAIYGPVFIGQVASAIGNKKMIFSGISTGLVGYAIGNYLGLGIAYLVKSLFF